MASGNQTKEVWSALDTVTDPELDQSVTSPGIRHFGANPTGE